MGAQVEAESKENQKKSGSKHLVGLSGRDLFTFDASLFVDDDGAASADEYDERSEVDEDADEAKSNLDDEGDDDDEGDGEGGAQGADGAARASEEVTINK